MLNIKVESLKSLYVDLNDESVYCYGNNLKLVNVCYTVMAKLARIKNMSRFLVYDGHDEIMIYPIPPQVTVSIKETVKNGLKLIKCSIGSEIPLTKVIEDVMGDYKNAILLSINNDFLCNATLAFYASSPTIVVSNYKNGKLYGLLIPSLAKVIIVP